jgi:hypothetical protein
LAAVRDYGKYSGRRGYGQRVELWAGEIGIVVRGQG